MPGKRNRIEFDGKGISRRVALRNMSLAGVGIPFSGLLFQSEGFAQAREPALGGIAIANPIFTVAERDRRWEVVRRIMARSQWNLDAIIALGSSDTAYTRYLTQIGGRAGSADVIFPRDPSKPAHALLPTERNKTFWEGRLAAWLSGGKLALSQGEGSKSVIGSLRALGLSRSGARIGVAKLVGSRFDPEGLVSATYLENLRSALAGVLFVPIERWGPDPGPVDEAAMVKSREEQEVIRRSVTVGEKAIETIMRSARPPAKRQADIWFATFTDMFAETGEDPTRLSIALDEPANSTLGAPVDDPLQPGQIISQEIDATVQGYRGQVNHSIFVGNSNTPGYNYYKNATEVAIKLFLDALALIVPGKTTCGQLVDHYAAAVEKLNAEDRSGVVLHSSGIANLSRPRIGPTNSRGDEGIVLVPGMTFDFKPAIRLKRDFIQDVKRTNRVVQIGDHILVTETGAVRLGRRELKPLTTAS